MNETGKGPALSGKDEMRWERRFKVELPVIVHTMLDDQPGRVVDVSRYGLKLDGIKAPPRAKVIVQFQGEFSEATVRWCKPGHGVGVMLHEPLRTGPLASVWRRFHENVEAFGRGAGRARAVFGRKQA